MKLKPPDDPGYAQTHFIGGHSIRVDAGGDYETDDAHLIEQLKDAGWKQVRAPKEEKADKAADKGKDK